MYILQAMLAPMYVNITFNYYNSTYRSLIYIDCDCIFSCIDPKFAVSVAKIYVTNGKFVINWTTIYDYR